MAKVAEAKWERQATVGTVKKVRTSNDSQGHSIDTLYTIHRERDRGSASASALDLTTRVSSTMACHVDAVI